MNGSPSCYHCRLPVPEASRWTVVIDGAPRAMCCPGCAAAAQAILDLGLGDYYRHRTAAPERAELLDELRKAELSVWNDVRLEDTYAPQQEGGNREAILQLEGMRCPACGWLVERSLRAMPGVQNCSVNYETGQALVDWSQSQCSLGDLLQRVQLTGYRASPWRPDASDQHARQEARGMLAGLGVAGIGMMQVMMYALGLYVGAWQGLDPATEALLRNGSLIMATLVLVFASRVFFVGAWRQLRALQPGMDVPVALAIGAAYGASVWHTLAGQGEVYFDSVCMFTFFLLLGRYLELRARQRAGTIAGNRAGLVPAHAWKQADGRTLAVPAVSLQAGDIVLLRAGEYCPADGIVRDGSSHIDESLLTGEPNPRPRMAGDAVSAGTMNLEHPLQIEVTAAGLQTRAAAIERAVARASGSRPPIAVLADRVARVFVPVVVLLTLAVWLVWLRIDPQRAFDVALSVLVVSCPCALSLATPAALASSVRALRQVGVLVTGARALDALQAIDLVIFDKTGTLTEGRMQLRDVALIDDVGRARCLQLAAALEQQDDHPVARALRALTLDGPTTVASEVRREAGAGIEGLIEGRRYRIGRPDYVLDGAEPPAMPANDDALAVLLGEPRRPLAWLLFDDELRPDARDSVHRLQAMGLQCALLSGDSTIRSQRCAEQLGIDRHAGDCSPEDKLQHLQRAATEGHRVLMIGDGVNDAPGLQAASVSLAMGSGSDLSRSRADAVLLNDRLEAIPCVIDIARRTRVIIRQNLGWALVYNLLALPVAACGLIPPWASALGMSASSLLVTINALRLTRPPAPRT